jgi:ATP-dependent DNA helicase DinG
MDVSRITGATVKLCAAPYHVGDQLRKLVFAKYPAIVCVSATLTSGGTFDFIRGELGLTDPVMTARTMTTRVASPFDYAKQAHFVIPYGIPFPTRENEEDFDRAAARALETLVHDCQGRTLALFTSWRRLNYIADYLRDKIDYPLLVQGDAPNKLLAQMFREQTNSVLLATKSFWMGLDVSGESLSCLVIDKLPFDSFDDPFVDMMKTKHPDSFYEDFYVPRAAIALAQGAGRLIRSTSDHGVFVLLDQRIKARRYGRAFLASLPFKGFSQDLADAGKFLATGPR